MSTLKSDSRGNSSESVYGSYGVIQDHNLCKGNSSSPGLVPNPKWWLNHHGLGRVYSHDQLNLFDADSQLLAENGIGKAGGENQLIEEYYTTCSKNDGTKKLGSDLDSHWIGVEKVEPWWQAADKDDLATLVSQMSSDHTRISDRQGVQMVCVGKVSDGCVEQFEEGMTDKETKASPLDESNHGNLASVRTDKSLGKRGLTDCMHQEEDGAFSNKDSSNTTNSLGTQEPTSNDLSRAQLLEALCHSQTRAREAEKLAQEACDEKDHIINLFFQQASCLFAYRQWLRMLQLETLCLHLRSKHQLSSFTPSILLNKGVILRKNRRRPAKKKLRKERCDISKCAIAFAIGLSLAGAGLLVGWTIGWLFPVI
ncbi:hypothetical protein CDL12_05896 [Handroanthus impetiginosus]|uniref:Transmembrane protein n=1 Tax=Handroanthus impetiginosus TaxID=429701 RepID=A0A2G9HVE0_9LAMI|nr:hypothetical protein CDL12_05896 [Handroanthus impetiginosus]